MATTRVEAPQLAAPRLGLIASARLPVTGSDTETFDGQTVRWVDGFASDPEDCLGGSNLDPCGEDDGAASTSPDDLTYTPYVVEAAVTCSTFGSVAEEAKARAGRKLAAVEQRLIEQELWTGDLAQAAGWSNLYLEGNATSLEGGAPLGFQTALAELEQAIADGLGGQRGMIHATPRTVSHWFAASLVRREGNLVLTGLDTIVVPGTGYPGTSPAGAAFSADTAWAYATGVVEVRRGAVFYTDTDTDAAGVDRSVNTRLVRAHRFAAATFDDCLTAGVRVDLTVALTDTGS